MTLGALLASAKPLAIQILIAGRLTRCRRCEPGPLRGIVENKRVLGGSVREVLQFVQSVELGVVFSTDGTSWWRAGRRAKLYTFRRKL